MKYDVYAIGNALVDLEIEISDEFLIEHGIEKGLMTLVNEERQQYLMDIVNQRIKKMQCGGSAANSIMALTQLGGKAYYACKVANDYLGDFFTSDLLEKGVHTNLKADSLPSGITGKCLVMVTPDTERTMNTFLGITSDFSVNEVDEDALSQAHYLYMEGYLISSPSGKKAMQKSLQLARKQGIHVALTFSDPSMVKYFGEAMHEVVNEGVDILFANEEEALTFSETSTLEDACEILSQKANHLVITRGARGALIYDGQQSIHIDTSPVKAVDANGAGDMFAGSYLYGITHGLAPEMAARLANRAAAQVVTQYGPRLPDGELQAIKGDLGIK